jgi:hypothetical protein
MHSIGGAFFFWQSNSKAEKFPFTFWRLEVLRELVILVSGGFYSRRALDTGFGSSGNTPY